MAERIILEGRQACVTGGDGADVRSELAGFVHAVQRAAVQGLDAEALADNLKWKATSGDLTVCVAELKPQLRRVRWIAPDSPAAFGPTATYRERRLAFPYVVLKAPFLKGKLVGRAELFYRTEPLRALGDALFWPNLLHVFAVVNLLGAAMHGNTLECPHDARGKTGKSKTRRLSRDCPVEG